MEGAMARSSTSTRAAGSRWRRAPSHSPRSRRASSARSEPERDAGVEIDVEGEGRRAELRVDARDEGHLLAEIVGDAAADAREERPGAHRVDAHLVAGRTAVLERR